MEGSPPFFTGSGRCSPKVVRCNCQSCYMFFSQVLSHLGREDLSRFVHFCTGSSLLPPGGFAGLKPLLQVRQINIFFGGLGWFLVFFFQISWGGGERGSLPTSHTCFNMFVLPDAESYQQLERVKYLNPWNKLLRSSSFRERLISYPPKVQRLVDNS